MTSSSPKNPADQRPTVTDIATMDPGHVATSLLVHEIEHIIGFIASQIAQDKRPSEPVIIWVDGNEATVLDLPPNDILTTCAPIFAELHRGGGTIDFATSPVSDEDLIKLQILIGSKGEKAHGPTILATRLAKYVGDWMAVHRIALLISDGFDGDKDCAYVIGTGDLHDYLYGSLKAVVVAVSSPPIPLAVMLEIIRQSAPVKTPPTLIAPVGLAHSLSAKLGPLAMPSSAELETSLAPSGRAMEDLA